MADFIAEANRALSAELSRLQPDQRALALDTRWAIQQEPTRDQLALLDDEPGRVYYALYTSPPPTVSLFQGPIQRQRMNLRGVIRHELEHRLGYDHQLDRIVQGCGIDIVPKAPAVGHNDDCPVCRMHGHLAKADRLAAGLAIASQQQGRIPVGLGGTIPLMRRELATARTLIPALEQMSPNRRGEVRVLAGCIGRSLQSLEGTLDPARAQDAARELHGCWWSGYTYGWAHFAAQGR